MQPGDRFGRVVVVGPCDRAYYYVCLCDCGEKKSIRKYSLINGTTRSCGCLRRELFAVRKTVHGRAPRGAAVSPEYAAWKALRQRCKSKPRYAGRVRVCARWDRFDNFLVDMGKRPSTEHSVDRINNDGDYEPSNCRWATREEQASNTSRNVRLRVGDKELTIAQWSRETGVPYETIRSRLKSGKSALEATGV